MREIKFRYRGQSPTGITAMHILMLEQLEKGHTFLNECFAFGWKILSRDQFTGLKDKNGKEIYEGDIVVNLMKPLHQYMDGISFGKVVWQRDGFMIKTKNYHQIQPDWIEIIGNIYENPELIKKDSIP